ncbi:MAG: methionine adenosyltransferase [Candidatus Dadabacteria bacterium]|nr:MAG: methionine adenosyltransferase [Candidatus Dadabacteria bacterium]
MVSEYHFTSESVSEGHPDKICDQISDAVLDAHLAEDPNSRVACETMVKNSVVVLGGEITSEAKVDYENIVREVIRSIGYDSAKLGFDCNSCEIIQFINQQSADISQGVNEGEGAFKEQGAGDQGLMFGFACNETEQLMPLPILLSHQLVQELARQRKNGEVSYLGPDSKAQVTVVYRDNKPAEVSTVVLSTQHSEDVDLKTLEEFVINNVVRRVIPASYLTAKTRFLINPTGRFVIGGPVGDCGLTGRKIIVDTYGGYSRHGGGAFSGKDPTKVDRSAAYAARHIAKNIVAAEIAKKCEVQLAYAIGVAEPVSVLVDTFGTGIVEDSRIATAVKEIFELRPRGIIESLDLLKPIYRPTAAYGHFGREPGDSGEFSWERTNRVEELKQALA